MANRKKNDPEAAASIDTPTAAPEWLNQAAERPEAIMFERPGTWVTGTIVRYSQGFNPTFNRHYPIIVLDTPQGLRSVHVFHATLLTKLNELRPAPGERVGIKREADRTSGGGRQYAVFTIVVPDRQAADAIPDFSKYEQDDDGLPY